MTVSIPIALLQYTGNESELRLDAFSVGEALSELDTRFQGLSALIVNESGTRMGQVFNSADEGKSWRLIAEWLPPVQSVSVATIT